MNKNNIIIIGAGIAGLSTAIALEQKGFEVTVYERHQSAQTMGAGIVLWSNASSVLNELNLLEAVKKVSSKPKNEDTAFIPVFFEAFGASFSSPEFIAKYRDFFDEVGTFYAKNLQLLMDNSSIDKSIKPVALGRILVSMLDGIVLHKGFFSMEKEAYEEMVKESIGVFRRGLMYYNH